jgi:hypothetical protein
MTKKTNSLIFRFGLNILWKNKSTKNKFVSKVIQLESILYKELKTKNLKVLFIYYKQKNINIFVYNFINKVKTLKSELVKYYKNSLSFKKVIEKFGLSRLYIKWFFQGIKLEKPMIIVELKVSQFFSNNYIIWFFHNKYIIHIIIKKLKIYNYLIFNKINWIFNCLKHLSKKKINIKLDKKKSRKKYRLKLRKISGLIKFKVFSIYLENIIFKLYNLSFKIRINNTLLKKSLFLKFKLNNKYRKQEFFYVFHTIILSFIYNKAKLLSDFISILIKNDKKHNKILKNFITIIEKVFYSNMVKLKGFKLRLSGKIGGKMRKSKFQYLLGKVQLQKLNLYLDFSLSISYTKFGAISVKVWLLNGDS